MAGRGPQLTPALSLQADLCVMTQLLGYVDPWEPCFVAAVLAIVFNPLFWNVVSAALPALGLGHGNQSFCFPLGGIQLGDVDQGSPSPWAFHHALAWPDGPKRLLEKAGQQALPTLPGGVTRSSSGWSGPTQFRVSSLSPSHTCSAHMVG